MNRKTAFVSVALAFAFAMLSSQTYLFAGAQSTEYLTPSTRFAIPQNNAAVAFSEVGIYKTATLVNNQTWAFTNLLLNCSNLYYRADLLSDTSHKDLNVTAYNSNITVTHFDVLLTPDANDANNIGQWLTDGWLNYTVKGEGNQTFGVRFGSMKWPMTWEVYVDGNQTGGDSNVPCDEGAVFNVAATNASVSIRYRWLPVSSPSLAEETQVLTQTEPTNASYTINPAAPPDKQTPTPSTSPSASSVPIGIIPENLYIIYAALAVASGILILAATALAIRKTIIEKT